MSEVAAKTSTRVKPIEIRIDLTGAGGYILSCNRRDRQSAHGGGDP